MRFKTFMKLYSEVFEYDSMEYYIAERGWEDWMNEVGDEDAIFWLTNIYEAAKEDFAVLRQSVDSNRARFARDYGVPLRTLENWEANVREIPFYTKVLLTYAILMEKCYDKSEE